MQAEVKDNVLNAKLDESLTALNVLEIMKQFSDQIAKASQCKSIVVDMAGTQVIDSLGVNMLVGLYKECRKKEKTFRVTNVAPQIQRLFDLYKLAGYFGIEQS